MKLSIVIPSYNGKLLLQSLLPTLVPMLQQKDIEITVVDNGSTDLTNEFLKQEHPEVNCIQLPYNTGFTGAVNAGIKAAFGEYILILNNDCFLNQNTVPLMMQFLETYPQYCATQPVVKTPEGQIENIGFKVDLSIGKAVAVTDSKDPIINEVYMQISPASQYLYGLSATCLLMRKDELTAIGMFDESFHSYLEDVDLAFRLAKQGKKYFPTLTAECIHQHMATSSTMGSYKEQHDLKNWVRIIKKNYPKELLTKYWWTLLVERLRNVSGLLKKM